MISTDNPANESGRVTTLKSDSILDALPGKEFDAITLLASRVCETPIAFIRLFLDDRTQWDKSGYGKKNSLLSVEDSISAAFFPQVGMVLEVSDTRSDDRFCHHPMVTGEPFIQFLTAVPICTLEGHVLGTLCVMDHQTRVLGKMQIESLQILADQVLHLLDLKKNSGTLETTVRKLEDRIKELEIFAHQAAHHLKSPLCSISMMTELFREQYAGQMDPEGIALLDTINESTSQLAGEVDDILNKRSRS